jgi:predicted nucleic acid-binding protein
MSQPNNPIAVVHPAVVVDANVSIAVCAREQDKLATAEAAINDYAAKGWTFYAPNVIVGEVLFALCKKLQDGSLTQTDYDDAVESFSEQMQMILPPPGGEASLIARAKEIRSGYGCSRSSDSIYIALTEELTKRGSAEFLTFDGDTVNQIAKNALTVKVNLLPI